MPATMKQLAVVQFFTWLGLFCMWMFFSLATAQQIFHTTDAKVGAFDEGTAFGGRTFAVVFDRVFRWWLSCCRSRRGRPAASWCMGLACWPRGTGPAGDRIDPRSSVVAITMIGVGIAWASILSMPYAMLSGALPAERMGVYMGIFNFFIVIPEIVASIALEPVVKNLFANDPVKVVMLGGASMVVAAAMVARVKDVGAESLRPG